MLKYYLLLPITLCLLTEKCYGDANYRLNTPIKPSSYSLTITPRFDTGDDSAFTFDGEVEIKITTESDTNEIKLHSEDLNFTSSDITLLRGATTILLNSSNPLTFDTNYTFAYIHLETELQVGFEYTLNILYKGPIRSDLNGFYRNYYIENGVKKWLGATQMEPTHARKVFPCFDEPDLKATFTLMLDRPSHYQPSLANTKLRTSNQLPNGYVRELFYPTPKMSTYLVAFLISEFEAAQTFTNGTQEFGIYTRPEAKNQSSYPFDFGLRVVNALGEYFGIDYYSTDANLKLDHVALIDFRAGAMENWGLITYREALLLYVPEESTPHYKYRVAQIIAHETTHMWFGNLVTCHWWSNTWLNEGFANYFQDYITAQIEPEVGSKDILVTGSAYEAYAADEVPTAPAITNNEVYSPAEISGHFGTITYSKAGAVIRMMHNLIGDPAFKYGLNQYLNDNKFEAGYPEKLYAALHAGVTNFNALSSYPTFNISDIMNSWISQAGHPVVQVDIDYENEQITLTQKRFYVDSSNKSDELYKIPITFTTAIAPDFLNTKPVFIMDSQSHTFNVSGIGENHSWVIFNLQESGFYRVNYDNHSWNIIASALKGDDREKIHHLNRAKIVNDMFALLFADEIKSDLLFDVLEFLEDETDYSVWYTAIRGFNKLRNAYLGSNVSSHIDNHVLELMEDAIKELSYEVNESDDTVTLKNRMQLIEYACKLGNEDCIEKTVKLFRDFVENDKVITPSLRPVSYCNGLRYGKGEDYDFLWNRMSTTNVANEARLIGEILGCTNDEAKLKSYLVSMLEENSPIRQQDLTMPLSSVLSNYGHVHVVLESLKENVTLWKSIYPSIDSVLTSVAASLHTDEEFENFDNWLSSCVQCDADTKTAVRTQLAKSKATTQWAKEHSSDIMKALTDGATISTPTLTLLIVCSFTVMFGKF